MAVKLLRYKEVKILKLLLNQRAVTLGILTPLGSGHMAIYSIVRPNVRMPQKDGCR